MAASASARPSPSTAYVGPSTSTRRTVPRPQRATSANGYAVGLEPGRPAVDGPDRRDHVDELGEAGDADPVRVAEQRDQQAADHERVRHVLLVLGERRGATEPRPVRLGLARHVVRQAPDVPLVHAQPDPLRGCPCAPRRRRRSRRRSRASGRARASRRGTPRRSRRPRDRSRRGRDTWSVTSHARSSTVAPTPRTSACPDRSCRRSTSSIDGSTRRIAAAGLGGQPPVLRPPSCGRSATGRPSRCRGTRSGRRTARGGRSPRAGPRTASRPGHCTYSTRSRAASAPRVPRFTASIGSAPARRAHAMKSSVPTRFGSIDRHARSRRTGRAGRGPTPSSQS